MTDSKAEPGYKAPDLTLVGEAHLRRYLETNGEVGYLWNGVPILVMTTKGHRSGEPRRHPIIFSRDDDNYVVIASKGGSPEHPKWYLNLCAEPRVQLQVKGDKFEAIARTAASPERERLWREAARHWPNYDVYATRTTRRIPVVVLEPVRSK
jgi:deazaflavin-dependent oxidoreductase (nitroreductase family)